MSNTICFFMVCCCWWSCILWYHSASLHEEAVHHQALESVISGNVQLIVVCCYLILCLFYNHILSPLRLSWTLTMMTMNQFGQLFLMGGGLIARQASSCLCVLSIRTMSCP